MRIHANGHKPIRFVEFVFIACVVSALLFTPDAWGQVPDKTKPTTQAPLELTGSVEIGAQIRDTQGGHAAKFEEVRDVPKGFFVTKLKVNLESSDSPYFFRFRGLEIRERDQRFTMNAGKVGRFRSHFMWDQIPHHFGTGQSFLVETAPGLYQVSPTLRTALQTLMLQVTDPARYPANGPLATRVRQELQTAPFTEVRLRRDQALFRQSFQATDNVELYAQFSWTKNRGTRPMGVGSFVRRAVPATPPPPSDIGGLWEGIGQEVLEPLNYRTTDLKLGAQFHGERWAAGAEYNLSLFRNRITSLTWENPFRVTDDQGCLPNAAPPPPQLCGAINRFRQVRWQSDLVPDNDSHTITVWGKFDVTPQTQLRGVFSLAYWTQNDAFLPWTLNTAIRPVQWDPVTTVTNPLDLNQLPASSSNSKMRNINQEYALVNSRETFRFQARYRSQFLDNQAPQIVFPGYAAFGDSTWRAARTDFFNLPIENLDWDFRRQNGEAGFQWDVLPSLTWKLDYLWEAWNRKQRDVNRNNEHSIRNRLDWEFNLSGNGGPAKDAEAAAPNLAGATILRLKFDYTYSNRRALAYNTQPLDFVANFAGSPAGGNTTAWVIRAPAGADPGTVLQLGVPTEFNLLRRYDQNDRTRNDGRLAVELLKGPNTSFSASYRYLGDEHDKNFYGRLFNRFSFIDAEFSHVFENGSFLFANYSRETNRYAYRDLAHLLPAANPLIQGVFAQFPIANTWERTSRSSLDSFELGINVAPQEGKLVNWQFDLSYALSFARDRISTANPFGPVRPDGIIHAGAFPYPDTVVRRQDVNIAVTRRISEKYEIGVRYWYEPYTQDDFSFNILAPYIHGNAASDLPKYMFQDARYGSYHANVASVFVRYSF